MVFGVPAGTRCYENMTIWFMRLFVIIVVLISKEDFASYVMSTHNPQSVAKGDKILIKSR
jgi:hypothetical protein